MKISEMLKYGMDFVKPRKGDARTVIVGKEPLSAISVEEIAEAIEINAGALAEILSTAVEGDPRRQAGLAFDLAENPTLGAHVRTRWLAVSGCDWSIVSTQEGEKGEKKATELRRMLDGAGMAKLIDHLAMAWWYGYAGAFLEWDGSSVAGFTLAHPTRWLFDRGGNPAISIPDRNDPEPLSALEPRLAVFATPGGGTSPQRAGICRSVGWMWMLKRNAWIWRSRYIERYGMPIFKATVTEDQWKDKDRLRKLRSSMEAAASRAGVIVPERASLDFISAGSNGSNADYQQYIADCNDEIMIAILGQLASAGEAGGLSKGQTQENVRLDLLAADCRMVEDAIQRQVVNPLVATNVSENAIGEFTFKLDFEPNEDELARADIIEKLGRSGLEVDEEWASKRFEMPLRRKAIVNSHSSGLDAMSDLSPRKARTEGKRRERAIDSIASAAISRLLADPEAAAAWVSPLKTEIASVFADIPLDAEDLPERVGTAAERLFERYPAVYAAMGGNAGAIEDAVRTAALTAVAIARSE